MSQRKLIALLVVAAIVVAGENYIYFSGDDAQPRRNLLDSDEDDAEDFEPSGEDAATPLEPVDLESVKAWRTAQAGPGRSPFLTRAEADALGESISLSLPRLEGTLFSRGRRIAWIGGWPHREGEWLGEHQLQRIEADAVWLVRGQEVTRLPVSGAPLHVKQELEPDVQ